MRNKSVIVSAPSGAGKTTIVRRLIDEVPELEFSISACSRPIRGKEIHGKDYYFLGVEGFKQAIRDNKLVEWEEVYQDQFYGTLKSELHRIWGSGKVVIFDVDVIGGLNLKKRFKEDALALFIKPPAVEVLKARLQKRGTESPEKIEMRIKKAKLELERIGEFDLVIENKDLESAVAQAKESVNSFIRS